MSEQWDFYPASIDDRQASVFIDLGMGPEAPTADRPELAWMSLRMNEPREDGLGPARIRG